MEQNAELETMLRDLKPSDIQKVLHLTRQLKRTEYFRHHPRLIAFYATIFSGLIVPILVAFNCQPK